MQCLKRELAAQPQQDQWAVAVAVTVTVGKQTCCLTDNSIVHHISRVTTIAVQYLLQVCYLVSCGGEVFILDETRL